MGITGLFWISLTLEASFPLQVWSSVPSCTSEGDVVPTGHSSGYHCPHPAYSASTLSLQPRKGHQEQLDTLGFYAFDLEELTAAQRYETEAADKIYKMLHSFFLS